MLWHNNTTWDENLIGKTTVVDGKEVIDTDAKEAVARFQEWISDVPRLKELRFKRYEPGHLESVAIFGDASQTGIGMVAYLIKNDNSVRCSHIFYSKSTLMRPKAAQQSRRRRRAHDSACGADRIGNVYQHEHLYQKCAEAQCAF